VNAFLRRYTLAQQRLCAPHEKRNLATLFLLLQGVVDRLIRRLRRGGRPERVRRRLVVVQIDGLSRTALDRGLAAGHMPYVAQMLANGGHRLHPMSVGMPTSTPAFQMAAMYGVRPDIPGFHYYDKRRRTDIHFPRAGHAAGVEAAHVEGRLGILHGGSIYGCVFTGGAENDLFSFARLTRASGPGVVRVLSGCVGIGWVALKGIGLTIAELLKFSRRFVVHPRGAGKRWQWAKITIGVSVWIRQFFTAQVARDLYEGVPAIYVNYLDYDVAAHTFGPQDRAAFRSLEFVDRSIRQIGRILRRVPEHQYDLYILSDHGQAPSTPFAELTGGKPLERLLFDELLDPAHLGRDPAPPGRPAAFAHGFMAYGIGRTGLGQRVMHQLDPEFSRTLEEREVHERGGFRDLGGTECLPLRGRHSRGASHRGDREAVPRSGRSHLREPWRGIRPRPIAVGAGLLLAWRPLRSRRWRAGTV
jgi:Type I phosphodiesterase / nucleotide pyrophosphatase